MSFAVRSAEVRGKQMCAYPGKPRCLKLAGRCGAIPPRVEGGAQSKSVIGAERFTLQLEEGFYVVLEAGARRKCQRPVGRV